MARLRVTGGTLRGRRFQSPGAPVRPTAERVREALFSRLGALDAVRVLDLYAGTGALGIEALSRGAASATFVERARPVLRVLRRNLAELGLEATSRVVPGDAPAAVARLAAQGERFHLVLVDPPYESAETERALRALVASGILVPEATVVVETSRRSDLPQVAGLTPQAERRYGDTRLVWWGPSRSGPAGDGSKGGTAEP